MLTWLGGEGDRLQSAFSRVFGERKRPFGKRSTWIGGLSDANEGVQWNAGYDPRDGRRWLGVNLEGMQYSEWPIARLINRELRNATLPALVREVGGTDPMYVLWARDYWQATSRPKILEGEIAPTPLPLSRLTEDGWRHALEGALACLDRKRNWRGRAIQEVTLATTGRRLEGSVSPHLTFVLPADERTSWLEFLGHAKARMQPFYDWTSDRATLPS
jgi:hypothetical protein